MRKMVDKVKINLYKIKSPLLLIHSTIDQTAPIENFEIIKDKLSTKQLETLVLDKTGHNVFDTELDDKKLIFDTIDNFISTIFNDK